MTTKKQMADTSWLDAHSEIVGDDAGIDPAAGSAPAPIAPGQPVDTSWLDAHSEVVQPDNDEGLLAGTLRKSAQGLLFGYGDEAEAALRTGFGYFGDYGNTVEDIRQKNETFGRKHPALSIAAEIGGSVQTMFVPGLGAGKAIQAVRAAPTLGTMMREGAMIGAKAGALSGAGNADPNTDLDAQGSISARLRGAAGGSVVGAGAGAGLGAAGKVADEAVQSARGYWNTGRLEGIPSAGARDVARALGQDKVKVDAIQRAAFPEYGKMTPDDVMGIVSEYGKAFNGGLSDVDARKQVAASLVAKGVNPRTAEDQVRKITRRYLDQNAIPMQLNELAAIAGGGDAAATHELYRAGINLKQGNEAASDAAAFVTARQPQIRGQLSDALERHLGDGDVNTMVREYEQRRAASGTEYGDVLERFNAHPEAQDALRHALDQTQVELAMKLGNRTDDIATAQWQQLGKFFNPYEIPEGALSGAGTGPALPRAITEKRGTNYLDAFIHQRRALSDAIEAAKGPFGKATATSRDLADLKKLIDKNVRGIADTHENDDVAKIFGDWREANDRLANTESLRRAYTDGMGLNISAKKGASLEGLNRTLSRMANASDEHQEMFARGVMAQLKAAIETGGDFDNAAKIFSNERMRDVLAKLMGKDEAEGFYQLVQRANLAKRTQMADKGSQTASIQEINARFQALSQLWEITHSILASPLMLVKKGVEVAANKVKAKRFSKTTELLSANTQDPAKLADTIEQMRRLTGISQPARVQLPAVRGIPRSLGGEVQLRDAVPVGANAVTRLISPFGPEHQ